MTVKFNKLFRVVITTLDNTLTHTHCNTPTDTDADIQIDAPITKKNTHTQTLKHGSIDPHRSTRTLTDTDTYTHSQ